MAERDSDDSTSYRNDPEAADPESIATPSRVPGLGQRPGTLAVHGVLWGAGLAVLGFLAAALALIDPIAPGGSAQAALAVRLFRALWLVLAFGLAGWAVFLTLRSSTILLRNLLARDSRRTREFENSLGQAITLLERIALAMEQRAEPLSSEQLTRSGQVHPAAGLQDRLAELKAAKDVNDSARVLELYHAIAPALEAEPRTSLQSEVAEWFLTLLYRRLRTGKIQVEVVELAARFAESFATTAQGASVCAALPMLRRSAGLCPRCAQPYIGVAQVCPECQRRGATPSRAELPEIDPAQPK